jgi:hypothetical protein
MPEIGRLRDMTSFVLSCVSRNSSQKRKGKKHLSWDSEKKTGDRFQTSRIQNSTFEIAPHSHTKRDRDRRLRERGVMREEKTNILGFILYENGLVFSPFLH